MITYFLYVLSRKRFICGVIVFHRKRSGGDYEQHRHRRNDDYSLFLPDSLFRYAHIPYVSE